MRRAFSFGHRRASGGGPPPSGGILQPGVRYWGACGHRDQGGIYQSRSLANQAADLKNIFGSTPNTVLYRALGGTPSAVDADAQALQALGIIPLPLVCAYPDWGSLANEAAAYAWAYNEADTLLSTASTIQIIEIGNEWNLQTGFSGGGDPQDPDDWRAQAAYPLYLGVHAGAIQAIRDFDPSIQVIFGPTSGWINTGFVPALDDDLLAYYGLSGDFTCNHHYNGQSVNAFGPPDNLNSNGTNTYQKLHPASATPKPAFFSEFGASASGSTDATAASRITGLMDQMYAQGMSASGGELGTIGGCVYEMYPHGEFATHYYLCDTDGSLKPQGTAVKNWIAAHP